MQVVEEDGYPPQNELYTMMKTHLSEFAIVRDRE
ncbi:hypothetical protein BSG1_20485 [Bacillus sp. SG-1]|nr:hypothetical protein BSG1_20485 [Bacillus sp. SG-1]